MPDPRAFLVAAIALSAALPGGLPRAAADGEALEEITVEGDRAQLNPQLRMERAEDAFYALFNELNTDDRYDVECGYEAMLGSRVKQRVCQAGFQEEELTRAALFSVMGMQYDAQGTLAGGQRELQRRIGELMRAHPQLREAADVLDERVEDYVRAYYSGSGRGE